METQSTFELVIAALTAGIPALVIQMGATGLLLALGVFIYKLITPYDETALVQQGNVAAAVLLAGSTLALAIPLAATLVNHIAVVDILLWGVVALVLQLGFFLVLTKLVHKTTFAKIEQNNIAMALATVGGQIAFALLNAGAMSG